MAARTGGIALFGLLLVGLVLGSRALSSPDTMLDVVAGDNKVMYAAIVAVFAFAAAVAMSSRSGVLRMVGGIVLLGCFSFGVMLWSSWNSPELAEAFEMIDDIDQQFAEVAAALEGASTGAPVVIGETRVSALVAADVTVEGLVASGHVLVGRQCDVNAFGSGRERLAYLSGDSDPELVQLTIEVVRGERTVVLDRTSSTGESPLLPFEGPCVS